jgi:hypothetical protein
MNSFQSLFSEPVDKHKAWKYALLLLPITFLLFGFPVPYGNELFYFARAIKAHQPDFLLNDWTLGQGGQEHWLFNELFGYLFAWLPLPIVGWSMRILAWFLTYSLFINVGQRLRIPPILTVLALHIWVLSGQSVVGGEWIIKGFEAKCVAYICLLSAILYLLERRNRIGGILLGLAFSFHPGVGLWGVPAVMAAYLFHSSSKKELLETAFFTFLFAIPELIVVVPIAFKKNASESEIWTMMFFSKMPIHLNPHLWGLRTLWIVFPVFFANTVHFFFNRKDDVVKFLYIFEVTLFIPFLLGLSTAYSGHYDLLKYMPFRLFPVFSLLFFFFYLTRLFATGDKISSSGWVFVSFLPALLALPDPITTSYDLLRTNYESWLEKPYAGLKPTLQWISKNTENGSIVIAPPWNHENWLWSSRGQIVSYPYHPYDRLTEWRERVEALSTKLDPKISQEEIFEDIRDGYRNLTEQQILLLKQKYGGDYLVSRTHYSFSILFQNDEYFVYKIP